MTTTLFYSYSHRDERLRKKLETHLTILERQHVIAAWHDRRLIAGDEIDSGISQELERADIILLLISADFLASNYCYSIEMKRAIERHDNGEARVIPVILRLCDWKRTPLGKLLATPKDGKPVTKWPDRDEAFLNIADAIRAAAAIVEETAKIKKDAESSKSKPAALATSGTHRNLDANAERVIRSTVLPGAIISIIPLMPGEPQEFANALGSILSSTSGVQVAVGSGNMIMNGQQGLIVQHDHNNLVSVSVFNALVKAGLNPMAGPSASGSVVYIKVAPR